LLHGLLAGKYATADDVPVERARTRHFSKKRRLTRHGGNGCEVEAFCAVDKIGEIATDLNQPMALLAISWLLRQQGVASVITGARQPKQIEQIAKASTLQLSPDILESLDSTTQKVKEILGTNPDTWLSYEESRYR
jgi:aryl-alcohol dehydrogenase-like predicted oxidoreductase